MKSDICGWVRDSITAYREGSLSGGAMRRFESHLVQCEDCATELRRDERLDAALASVAVAEPRPATWAEAQVRRTIHPTSRPWKPVGALASVAAAATLVWFGFFGAGPHVAHPDNAAQTSATLDQEDSASLVASHQLMSVSSAGGDPNRMVVLMANRKSLP